MACNVNSGNSAPRVVVVGLASCFGCQLQITNAEAHLLELLGQFDLKYWQLASSDPMPEGDFDVAIIEGAVTTEESVRTVRELRQRSAKVIAIGACATTAGIPGMAAADHGGHVARVYGELPEACGEAIEPCSVPSVIDVDFEVRCCPIDSMEFIQVLERALYGSNATISTGTLCGSCKRNEDLCLWAQGRQCLGLVTLSGCGAKCVNLGRECNGCRGLSPDANLDAARNLVMRYGMDIDAFDASLQIFNQTDPMVTGGGR